MSSPATPADPILDPLMRNRPAVGIVLAVLAALFLVGGGYCFTKAFSDTPAAEEDKAKPSLNDLGKDADTQLKRPYSTEYILGGIAGVVCALICGGVGGWLLGRMPSPNTTEDRLLLFLVGGGLGVAFMLLGFALFYLWFGELAKWLGQAEKAEPLKPLIAMLAFLLGAGLLFAGVQPLRAEERNDLLLRRIVYGTNFFLTTLLLVVGLIFVNVLATLKLPSKLDTTESGFYTLSDTTKDYVAKLDKDVIIYSTIPETREGTDILRVLNAFQEANPKQVKLKQLSLTLDKAEIAALKTKFPSTDLVDADGRPRLGILIALGPDEKRYQFIQSAELFGREESKAGQAPGRRTFQAEPKIIREVLFLTENKQKPVIYFTQGSGELAIDPSAPGVERGPNFRAGTFLKQALIADYCDVKPLVFDALAPDPQIPADATVVCIADPTSKLSDGAIRALTKYMGSPRPDGTKGKLLVIAGAHPDPQQPRQILKLGLEPLLAEFGVAPMDRAAYFQPQDLPANVAVAGVTGNLVDERNTIALAFAKSQIIAVDVRPIDFNPQPGKYKAMPLLGSLPDRITWLEDGPVANPNRAFEALMAANAAKRSDILKAKDAKQNSPRVLAAISSEMTEGNTGRAVIFGYSGFEDDDMMAKQGYTVPPELVTASVNWLRDRPAVANEGAKPYGIYTPSAKWDWTRGYTLPVMLVILGIAAVGLGLWVLRRR